MKSSTTNSTIYYLNYTFPSHYINDNRIFALQKLENMHEINVTSFFLMQNIIALFDLE